jgi:phenylacetate-CoA ligase
MSTSHISAESAPGYLAAMLRFQPELMDGYPSAFAVMARLASSQGLKAPRPRAIITSAETLLPEDKLLIEQVFGCAVFDQYASSDTAAFMCSCEHGAMHVNPEFGLCEILDERGDPVPAGQEGEIVATSFCNTEQVFIRYRTGDTAIPAEGPCPCGRHMPAVAAITGRMDDILYTLERGYVGRLDPVFKGLSGIIEAQLIQENLGRIRVLTVPAPCVRPDYSALTANMRKKLGDKIDIVIEEVAVIPRGPNGKFRSVISKCRDEYPKS